MSPIPPANLVTAIREASSLLTEWSMRRFAPTLACIEAIISSVMTACGITACFSWACSDSVLNACPLRSTSDWKGYGSIV